MPKKNGEEFNYEIAVKAYKSLENEKSRRIIRGDRPLTNEEAKILLDENLDMVGLPPEWPNYVKAYNMSRERGSSIEAAVMTVKRSSCSEHKKLGLV